MRQIGFAIALIVLVGCKPDKPLPPAASSTTVPPEVKSEVPKSDIQQLRENFARVQFEFDSATLTADAKRALEANAAILQKHPDLQVEVQGHADERGTTEYNLALGERRASAVVSYLSVMGVSNARLTVVSWGEERPLAGGSGETVWAQNRRAEFRVLSANAVVIGTTAEG